MSILILAIIGSIVPPVAVFMEKGLNIDFWINLAFFIFIPWIGGVAHCFIIIGGLELCQSILCGLLPPVGVAMMKGCGFEVCVSICLSLCLWFPGVVYAYYLGLEKSYKGGKFNGSTPLMR